MRINAFIAQATGISRRKAEEFVRAGRVTIDARPAELTDRVAPGAAVTLDGAEIALSEKIYLALNKPAGVVTARSDLREKTVMDVLPKRFRKLFPVGRLDMDTRGLLLFTNDGEWSNRIMHPSHGVPRTYIVETDKPANIAALARGIRLRDGFSRFDSVRKRSASGTTVEVILHEGRKRQIRRTFERLGCRVIDLVRTEIGDIKLGVLEEGSVRILAPAEVDSVWRMPENMQRTSSRRSGKR